MAKTVVTTDDLDNSAGAETVEFSLAGVSYEIDLSKKNTAAMEKALKPYLDAARTVSNGARKSTSKGRARSAGRRTSTSPDLAAVRAWAAENGYDVSSRGRIAQDVMDAYTAAQ